MNISNYFKTKKGKNSEKKHSTREKVQGRKAAYHLMLAFQQIFDAELIKINGFQNWRSFSFMNNLGILPKGMLLQSVNVILLRVFLC